MNELRIEKFPTSLGVFSPTGQIVMAFATDSDAKRAQNALLDGGFKDEDVPHYNKVEVLSEFEERARSNP